MEKKSNESRTWAYSRIFNKLQRVKKPNINPMDGYYQ